MLLKQFRMRQNETKLVLQSYCRSLLNFSILSLEIRL